MADNKYERWEVSDCRNCNAMCVDCCDQCCRCIDCCTCYGLTEEEAQLVVGAIPLQALPGGNDG